MAAVARRHHAVEHVDAARDRFEDVVGRADAHQIARPVGRQLRRRLLDHRQHHVLRLADRKAADGVALEIRCRPARARSRRAARGSSPPCTMPNSALPGLRALEGALAALGPAQRQLHRALDLVARRRQPQAFVELHGDVGAEQPLDLDRALRRQLDASRRRYASGRSRPARRACAARDSDITWKPPESVRIGSCQFMKLCRPPSAATRSAPGRSIR